MDGLDPNLTIDDVRATAVDEVFGKPLMVNVFRAVIVEALVATSLGADWTWCSGEWAPCDFRHANGA